MVADLDTGRLGRTRALVNSAVRDGLVTGYEPLIEALTLPDPDDQHVLAAATKARAQQIDLRSPLPRFGSDSKASASLIERRHVSHSSRVSMLENQARHCRRTL
ncbi:MAG: hypothetical protein QOF52_131 [Propionibacteriaceae bacterium]|jgi:hypothetical protein|nr:hypothetical protein [Propionibacteriaceae bacterium]MDX6320273.1 hypothetical protein [Propionibacteriaceae bacterium]